MNSGNKQDELRGLNSSLPSDNKETFSVPDGYFDGLATAVLAKIKSIESKGAAEEIAELSPLLAGLPRKMPYSVPEGFFESSLNDVPVLMSDKEDSAVLTYIGKDLPYSVPDDYFDNLAGQVLAIVAPKRAKVIPIVRRKWMRMATAAMVFGVIGLSGIVYFTGNDSPKDPMAQIKTASTSDLDAFLKNTDANLLGSTTAQSPSKNNEVKEMLKNVPDNELNAFLSEVPSDDVESLTN